MIKKSERSIVKLSKSTLISKTVKMCRLLFNAINCKTIVRFLEVRVRVIDYIKYEAVNKNSK
jgi:hypothetical protein